ncbi:MAG TPA: hypothetical protein EYH07_14940 [Kiloniellaceae bacterium]|nr:hypothetical protein [Kiloniellaceae bacterium]
MPLPLNIIDLAITEEISADTAEVARRLEQAAELVEGFAQQTGLEALDSLLIMADEAASDGPTKDVVEEVRRIAGDIDDQSGILLCEVERFVSVSTER